MNLNFKEQPPSGGFFVGGKVMKNPERVAELLAELRSLDDLNIGVIMRFLRKKLSPL